jgi:hypothetical protein
VIQYSGPSACSWCRVAALIASCCCCCLHAYAHTPRDPGSLACPYYCSPCCCCCWLLLLLLLLSLSLLLLLPSCCCCLCCLCCCPGPVLSCVPTQGELEKGLARVTLPVGRVVGASRTDGGAHALGQVAHVDVSGSPDSIQPDSLMMYLNGVLPGDVKVRHIGVAPEGEGTDRHQRLLTGWTAGAVHAACEAAMPHSQADDLSLSYACMQHAAASAHILRCSQQVWACRRAVWGCSCAWPSFECGLLDKGLTVLPTVLLGQALTATAALWARSTCTSSQEAFQTLCRQEQAGTWSCSWETLWPQTHNRHHVVASGIYTCASLVPLVARLARSARTAACTGQQAWHPNKTISGLWFSV